MLNKIKIIIDRILFPRHRKIWHIYTGIAGLLIFPVIFMSTLSLYNTYRTATKFALSENKSEAYLVASILKERLDMLVEFGKSVAQRPNLIGPLEEGKWDEAIKAIASVPVDFEYVDRVLLVDKQGVIRAQSPDQPNYVGLRRSDIDWYRGVSKEWKTFVSQVYSDPVIPERNIIAIAVPIKIYGLTGDESNIYRYAINSDKVVGILLLHVSVKTFADLAREETAVDPGEFIYIIDNIGNLVVHPKFQDMGGVINYKDAPAVQKLLAGVRGSEINYNPIEKERRVVAFERVKNYGWGVVVVKPYDLAFAQRSQNLKNASFFHLIMLMLSVLAAMLILFILTERRRIDALKDDFISTVSHEIRNPLFAIRESISQVTEGIRGPITKEQNDFLEIALTSIDRLSRIINDLLDVAKMDAGKLRLNFKWCNVVGIARQSMAVFSSQARVKGIEIKERFPNEELHIFIDEERIIQVLFNLIGNALKFTQSGFIEVAIIDKSDVVECSVADTGIGISKERLADIFSKSSRYTSTSRSRGKGTGLGLVITKEIITMHGGNILVESAENKGSKVTFILPKYSPQEAATRFLDNMIPSGGRKKSLVMIFYDIENMGILKSKFGNEKIISIKQKMEKFINLYIRRVAGDIELTGTQAFLVLLPSLDTAHASLTVNRIGGSINEYLTEEGLLSEVKLNTSIITYPQVRNKNKDLFAKLVNHIVECKMR
ncbi:MAG: sensor histidine kinase [Candidatus Omnitrophota bacterium]|nr:sensor histidine kinase [Candidatus Omnitrophota bacterium]MBU1929030.1 sensor histidine kinase [Candidatus Omnitrophota bacterium]MBU2035277.1 sensor histidine kinase [Candidatus Omnitrophota bacterium]MBU2257672.1 sensor histidine kinase [Candidatus Omnitrophota bacterium]